MDVSVKIQGLEQAAQRLAAIGRAVTPVTRGALNTTATKTRTDRYVRPLNRAIKGKRLRGALRIKRANTRNMNSRIIPSSSSILVANYKTWGYDAVTPTRARLWVAGPNGQKVAAGFVNPASVNKLPLRTKGGRGTTVGGKRPLQMALGPSAAYWFKQLTTSQTVRWVNAYLQQEFAKRMRAEIAKGAR